MPEAALATPPAAPAAAPAATPTAAPAAPPTIKQSQMPEAPRHPSEPTPGSAKERMFQDLRKKAGSEPAPDPNPATPDATTDAEPDLSDEKIQDAEIEKALKSGDKKKMGPWKLLQEYKKRARQVELELGELKKGGGTVDPDSRRTFEERATKAEQRAQELEKAIAFHDYRQSSEFQQKYQKPYEDAFKRAMHELGELEVTDDTTGDRRKMSVDDMLDLVNSPLQKAAELARGKFGDFSAEAMQHRNKIKELFEQQQQALEDAKETAVVTAKQKKEMAERTSAETSKFARERWEKFNNEAQSDPKVGVFFKEKEGDEEGNTRLKKGYELVDKAFFGASLTDPSLTPQQREQAIRLHTAVRNRAAAFGRLTHWLEKVTKERDDYKAKLDAYSDSAPGAEPRGADGQLEQQPTSATGRMMADLRKIAK